MVEITHAETGETLLVVDAEELAGANLSGVNVNGADLFDVDLTGACLRGTNLEGADLTAPRWLARTSGSALLRGASLDYVNFGMRSSMGNRYRSQVAD